MKKIVVLYHGDCWDGFGGAWAAWKKFGSRANYKAIKYGAQSEKVIHSLRDKEVYIIDFNFPTLKTMREIVSNNNKVVVLDHHISGEQSIKLAHEYRYAINHSGAVLAWHYFFPKKKVPKLLLYIEDMDIWKFKLPYTKEIFAYLDLHKYDFKIFSKIVSLIERASSRKKFIENGREILRHKNHLIERVITNAQVVKFGRYKVLAVNSPVFASELGNKLAKQKPPFSIIWNEGEGIVKVSLRGIDKVDVSKIAERFGGGGHKNAAGFVIPLGKKLPWKIVKTNKLND